MRRGQEDRAAFITQYWCGILVTMKRIVCALLLLAFCLEFVPVSLAQETDAERRIRLEKELEQIERQILTQRRLVEDTQLERQSLERDLELIDGEIRQAQLGIQARAVAIEQLQEQIDEKGEVIGILNERLVKQQQSLANLVRKSAEEDDYSLAELVLSNENFSEFFKDFESFQSIREALNESVDILKQIRRDTEDQKFALESRQLDEAEMKRVQEVEKQEIEQKEAEKERILTVTKGQEEAYQQLLESQQKTAAQLRAQLFELLGGGGAIPFPEAVRLAKTAGARTGVPPALILAILEQESS